MKTKIVGRYDMRRYKTVMRESMSWNANWKNLIENFESYSKKGIRSFDGNDNEIISKVKGSEALLAGVTGPAESMRIMSEQVLVLPSGKVVTPIRQFCETKILPVGTKEAYFFDFGAVTFDNITETDDAIGSSGAVLV